MHPPPRIRLARQGAEAGNQNICFIEGSLGSLMATYDHPNLRKYLVSTTIATKGRVHAEIMNDARTVRKTAGAAASAACPSLTWGPHYPVEAALLGLAGGSLSEPEELCECLSSRYYSRYYIYGVYIVYVWYITYVYVYIYVVYICGIYKLYILLWYLYVVYIYIFK